MSKGSRTRKGGKSPKVEDATPAATASEAPSGGAVKDSDPLAGFDEGEPKLFDTTTPTVAEVDAVLDAAREIFKEPIPVVMDAAAHAAFAEVFLPAARPRFDEPDKDAEEIDLNHAAQSMMVGFKSHWIPALRAKADSMGMKKVRTTKKEWRRIFVAWGGVSAVH